MARLATADLHHDDENILGFRHFVFSRLQVPLSVHRESAAGVALCLILGLATMGCRQPVEEPLKLDGNMLTVDNRTSQDWTNVEIWLNSYFRVTTATIPAKGQFKAPLDVFIDGFGRRFDFKQIQIRELKLIAKLPDGQPLELKKQFEAGGLAGALGGKQ